MASEELVPYVEQELTAAELDTLSFGAQRAARWFREMGFRPEQCMLLAIAQAPPARVERALWQGCPLDLAFDIWT